TDAALLQGDAPRAAAALQAFVDRTPYIPALAKLVGIAVEAGLGDRQRETQAQLVDAYLEASRGDDARIVAEDLVRVEPANEAHAARLLRALTLSGEADPESALARIRESHDVSTADAPSIAILHSDVMTPETEQPSDVPDSRVVSDEEEVLAVPLAEIDLSTALSGLASTAPEAGGDEDVFAQMRAQSARDQQTSAALAQYEEGARLIEQGLDREAIAALESAARVPMLRFKAAARLGRFLIDRGDLTEGIEWLERAAEAPAPSAAEGHDLLYELAGALEAQGEPARALAVLMELDAEADGYRDVRTRITYLSRTQQTESQRS